MTREDNTSNPPFRRAFKTLIRAAPDYAAAGAMEEEFYLSSDRNAAILQASNIEFWLERLLIFNMRRLSADDFEKIFEGNGPLSTFSAKTNIAYGLRLFGPVVRRDLDIIRELRNGFAHSRHPLQFTQPEVAAMCRNLAMSAHATLSWLPVVYLDRFPLEIAADDNHPRTQFTRACHTISLCFADACYVLEGRGGVERTLP